MDTPRIDDLVEASRLPEMLPNLVNAHRLKYWLRNRKQNGLEESGGLFVRDQVAYANLPKLAAWLVSPEGRPKRRRRG